jgi:ribosomal protein S18 acetylase RimI-like enzyme
VGIELVVETSFDPAKYASVPCAFEVSHRAVAVRDGAGVYQLREEPVEARYFKDYDAIAGNHPRDWAARFDLTRWMFAAAVMDNRRVAGAALALDPMEAGSAAGTGVLWDIRVHPSHRGVGVGRQLLGFVEQRAREAGIVRVDVETQDINVAACRLYAGAGYVLTRVQPGAYAELPDEVRLDWRKVLA